MHPHRRLPDRPEHAPCRGGPPDGAALGFFTGNRSGELRKIIDDNAALTEDLLAHKLPDLTAAVVTPLAAIVLLFVFDWRMGLLCLLTMVLALGCMMAMMGGRNAGFFHRYQREIEKMSGEAVEYVRGIRW